MLRLQTPRKDLVHIMIQEVGVDLEIKRILWVRARPDYEPLFSILDSLRLDGKKRYWIEPNEPEGNISDIEADNGQMSTGVEIFLPMSHNDLRIDAARRPKTTPLTGAQPPHNPQLD